MLGLLLEGFRFVGSWQELMGWPETCVHLGCFRGKSRPAVLQCVQAHVLREATPHEPGLEKRPPDRGIVRTNAGANFDIVEVPARLGTLSDFRSLRVAARGTCTESRLS